MIESVLQEMQANLPTESVSGDLVGAIIGCMLDADDAAARVTTQPEGRMADAQVASMKAICYTILLHASTTGSRGLTP